ncbi:MAG: hypothetical protein KDA42_19860, partial [Planctomycetales bacterium]|nr:hypothetical protein [Planctomycetales bacterium]
VEAGDVTSDEVAAQIEAHPDIQDLVFAIQDSQRRMDAIRKVSVRGQRDPKYEEAAKQFEAGRQALTARREEIRTEIVEQAHQDWLDRREQQQTRLESEIHDQRMQLEVLVRAHFAQLKSLRSADPAELARRMLEDRIEQQEQAIRELNRRAIRLQTEQQAPAQVTVLRRAHS